MTHHWCVCKACPRCVSEPAYKPTSVRWPIDFNHFPLLLLSSRKFLFVRELLCIHKALRGVLSFVAVLLRLCTGKQHSSEFSRLVAQVRGRMETSKRARQIKQEKESASEDTSCEGEANIAHPPVPPVPSVSDPHGVWWWNHTHTPLRIYALVPTDVSTALRESRFELSVCTLPPTPFLPSMLHLTHDGSEKSQMIRARISLWDRHKMELFPLIAMLTLCQHPRLGSLHTRTCKHFWMGAVFLISRKVIADNAPYWDTCKLQEASRVV